MAAKPNTNAPRSNASERSRSVAKAAPGNSAPAKRKKRAATVLRIPRNSERAERVIAFIQTLKIPDGKDFGKPFILRDWQIAIIYAIYAPMDPVTRLRLVQTAVLTMARKNGKTALIAALVLVHLVGPEASWNAQIYSAAFERSQAALVYRAVASMVRQDAELHDLLSLTDSSKRVLYPDTGSTYQALSAESRSKHGLNPTLVIMDELAQFGADRELFDVLTTSVGAQSEPLVVVISTQAANDNAVLSELIDYGRQVNSGEVEDSSFLLVEFSIPMELDVWDETNWLLANPGIGDFRSLDEMRKFARRAKKSPSLERTFRNLYCNQRVAGEAALIAPSVWDANGSEPREDLQGRPCFAALDLSGKLDLTSLTLVFPEEETGQFDVLPFFWSPQDSIDERSKRDKVPYYDWWKQGLIEAPPGMAIDYRYVVHKLIELSTMYDIRAVAFDRWRIDIIKLLLKSEGVSEEDLVLVPFGQGFKDMSPAVDRVEELLLSNMIRHGNHPVLRWCASNAVAIKDPAGNRKLDKAKSFGRIDGLVTLAMGLQLAQSTDVKFTVYKKRGLVVI